MYIILTISKINIIVDYKSKFYITYNINLVICLRIRRESLGYHYNLVRHQIYETIVTANLNINIIINPMVEYYLS